MMLPTLAAAATLTVEWCAVPPTVQILQNASCASLGASTNTAQRIDVVGMRGERESVQLLLRSPGNKLTVTVRATGAAANADVRQVGYVNCSATTRYPTW